MCEDWWSGDPQRVGSLMKSGIQWSVNQVPLSVDDTRARRLILFIVSTHQLAAETRKGSSHHVTTATVVTACDKCQ